MHYISNLFDDILAQIFQMLSVRDILSLRKTSKRYYFLSKLRCVWYAALHAHVLARCLPHPVPTRYLSSLSSTDLEHRTLLALSLDRRWPRLKPDVIVSSQKREIIDQILLIPGGIQVLTVHGNKVVCWLIAGQPGGSQKLKKVGEWSSPTNDACVVVKDMEQQGIIAIGSRDQPNQYVAIFSLTLKPEFRKLCDYSPVPGIIAGISENLLFLDTTSDKEGGGLAVLDWHAKTGGIALLPCIPELFGAFLGFSQFSDHILVAWEACITVFPVPAIPAQGRTVVAHTKVFIFSEHMSAPVSFTTCVPRGWSATEAPENDACQETPSITVAACPKGQPGRISMTMLIPLVNHGGTKQQNPPSFPYRLLQLSPFVPGVLGNISRGLGGRKCTRICIGSSGRGLCVIGEEVRLCGPSLLLIPPCEMEFGPAFEMGKAVYEIDADGDSVGGDKVDFDEGMGRMVVARRSGGFDVVQLL